MADSAKAQARSSSQRQGCQRCGTPRSRPGASDPHNQFSVLGARSSVACRRRIAQAPRGGPRGHLDTSADRRVRCVLIWRCPTTKRSNSGSRSAGCSGAPTRPLRTLGHQAAYLFRTCSQGTRSSEPSAWSAAKYLLSANSSVSTCFGNPLRCARLPTSSSSKYERVASGSSQPNAS